MQCGDIQALTDMLTQDVTWSMPPIPTWFAGRDVIARFLATRLLAPGDHRMVPTMANGQPAFALYVRGHDGVRRAVAVQVLTLTASGIARVVAFHDPGLFTRFGLPSAHSATASAAPTARR
jgi:RNA polymerase sigma-70 factor (ECF subfamily)